MIEIEYNEESCTNWYTDVRGATPKEAIIAFINNCDDDVLLAMARDFATGYGDYIESSLGTCETCGHYPAKHILKIGEDNE